jgi:hypothetical protein
MDTILRGWPYVGLCMAPLLLVGLALERRPGALPRFQDPAWVLPLLWPMYLLHQFEEHGIDMLGRHYGFLGDLCDTLGHAQAPSGCPADPAFIFAVNAVGCQMAFALSFLFRRRRPLVAACAWGIPLVNGVAHVGADLAHRAYNPGGRRSRRRQVWQCDCACSLRSRREPRRRKSSITSACPWSRPGHDHDRGTQRNSGCTRRPWSRPRLPPSWRSEGAARARPEHGVTSSARDAGHGARGAGRASFCMSSRNQSISH